MPIQAARFSGDTTLLACVDSGYRMTFNDPNAESVRKVQFALMELGYPLQRGADGMFGQGGSRTVPRSRATGFSKTSSGCSRIPPAVADVKRAAMPHGHGIKSPAHQPAAKCNRQKFPAGFGVATNRTRMPGAETCLYAHAYADRPWREEQFS